MWGYLILGAGFAFAAAVQPGPFQTFLISETLSKGWRRTVPAAFAPLISDVPIVLAALLFLTQISTEVIRYLHLVGAVFLFYLAWGAFSSWRRGSTGNMPDNTTDKSTLFKAALVNFLNPNPWLGWSLVMGPLVLQGYRESPIKGVAIVVGFYLTMIVCLVGVITVFAFARKSGPKVQRAALGLSVIALAGFGVFQLWMGL